MSIRSLTSPNAVSSVKRNTVWDEVSSLNTGMELIAQQVYTSSGTGQIEFANIPQTYTHLYMLSKARDGDASNTDIAFTSVIFNNNTSVNRQTTFTYGYSTNALTSTVYQTAAYGVGIQRGNGPSGAYATSITHIPFYTASSREKHFHWETGVTGTSTWGFLGFGVTHYAMVDPITNIKIDQGNVNWAAGSMVQLYGVK
jgi:hypothetical protein